MKKIAILASGNGSNFEHLVKKINQNKIKNVSLKFLFCNKKKSYVIERAKRLNIKTIVFQIKDFKSKDDFNQSLLKLLLESKIDYVILAGYMRIIPEYIIEHFPNRIINIHPSYLPNFKGMNVIQKAYDSNVKYTGVSIHYVVPDMDAGEIILQKKIKINRKKSVEFLEKKIHNLEYKIFYKAINKAIKYNQENIR